MSFSSLNKLLQPPLGGGRIWHESDCKHFIEQYLRHELKTEALYCESVRSGRATVSVGSPTLLQAVRLLEFDLTLRLQQEGNYALKSLTVVQRW